MCAPAYPLGTILGSLCAYVPITLGTPAAAIRTAVMLCRVGRWRAGREFCTEREDARVHARSVATVFEDTDRTFRRKQEIIMWDIFRRDIFRRQRRNSHIHEHTALHRPGGQVA